MPTSPSSNGQPALSREAPAGDGRTSSPLPPSAACSISPSPPSGIGPTSPRKRPGMVRRFPRKVCCCGVCRVRLPSRCRQPSLRDGRLLRDALQREERCPSPRGHLLDSRQLYVPQRFALAASALFRAQDMTAGRTGLMARVSGTFTVSRHMSSSRHARGTPQTTSRHRGSGQCSWASTRVSPRSTT